VCKYHDNNAMCRSCRPEAFHTPKDYVKSDIWWAEWETLEDLKVVVARLNEMYREGDTQHPWYDLDEKESDRRYDYLVQRIHEMDKEYEELL